MGEHHLTHPPVQELVLSVYFERLDPSKEILLPKFWDIVRGDYPVTSIKNPRAFIVESFDNVIEPQKILQPASPCRFWLMNESKTRVIQVQGDGFAINWMRNDQGDEMYPRFEPMLESFKDLLVKFREFVKTNGIGDIRTIQCETEYVSRILEKNIFKEFSDAKSVFKIAAVFDNEMQVDTDHFADSICFEVLQTNFSFLVRDSESKPIARITTQINPAILASSREQALIVNNVARGAPLSDHPIDGAVSFFRRANKWLGRVFRESITEEAHNLWE
ncbi:MAG: TIGR04255 family protein [Planctomycetes bacterium]|nr:TIGR04255 family protein [Planctomycetota bacterium]